MGVRLLGVMGAGNLRGDCGVGDLYAGGGISGIVWAAGCRGGAVALLFLLKGE